MPPIGYAGYKHVIASTTDNKEEILLKLYETMTLSLKMAHKGIVSKSPKIRGENISKVMAVLTELDASLDRENGGELADNLSRLYRFVMDRLTIANFRNDAAALEDADNVISELHQGFKAAAEQVKQGPVCPQNISIGQTEGVNIAV